MKAYLCKQFFFLESTYRVRVVNLAVLDVFGLSWAEKSSQHGPNLAFKTCPTSTKNRKIITKSSSGHGFGCLGKVLVRSWRLGRHLGASWRPLGPSWAEKGGQHGSNLAPKTGPTSTENRYQDACLCCLHFLIDFYSQLRLPEPSKSLFFLRKNKVFSKKRFSKLASIFDAMLVPTWLNFGAKLASKIEKQKTI